MRIRRKLLVIAYYFPPLGMGGTQRVAKFCKYLPRFGWEPTVVTVHPPSAYYALDAGLLKDVASVAVHRTASLDLLYVAGLLRNRRGNQGSGPTSGKWRRIANFLPPDGKVGWLPFILRKASGLVRAERFDALLVTSPPHSAQFAGALVSRRFGLPWVADFRDRWARGEFQEAWTPLHRAFDRWGEKFVTRAADAVVAVTEGLADHLRKSTQGTTAVYRVYNGFDPEDFEHFWRAGKRADERDKHFRLVFVGAITQVAWPGDLLRLLTEMGQNFKRRLRVTFCGVDLTGELRARINALGLEDCVEITGYLKHSEAVRALCEADVLYLPVSRSVSRAYVPGKLFEYLASRRPILASVPAGEADALLREADCAWVSEPGDLASLRDHLEELLSLWEQGQLPARKPERFARFSRVEQARSLAKILDSVVRGR